MAFVAAELSGDIHCMCPGCSRAFGSRSPVVGDNMGAGFCITPFPLNSAASAPLRLPMR